MVLQKSWFGAQETFTVKNATAHFPVYETFWVSNIKNAIFLKLHKNPCQANKITPNVVPTSQTQLSEQRISYCWNFKAFWVPNMHCSMNAWEIMISQCISVWYSNATNQDCKALQRVVRLAERISGSALPSLQDIYLKRCKSRAAKIIKDSNHPGNHLFTLLPSGKRFRSMMAKTERLRRSFYPQAIRLLNSVS